MLSTFHLIYSDEKRFFMFLREVFVFEIVQEVIINIDGPGGKKLVPVADYLCLEDISKC